MPGTRRARRSTRRRSRSRRWARPSGCRRRRRRRRSRTPPGPARARRPAAAPGGVGRGRRLGGGLRRGQKAEGDQSDEWHAARNLKPGSGDARGPESPAPRRCRSRWRRRRGRQRKTAGQVLYPTGGAKQPCRPASPKPRRRPMFFIDIAVPRDVDPEMGKLEGLFVYDIDDLQAVAAGCSPGRTEPRSQRCRDADCRRGGAIPCAATDGECGAGDCGVAAASRGDSAGGAETDAGPAR